MVIDLPSEFITGNAKTKIVTAPARRLTSAIPSSQRKYVDLLKELMRERQIHRREEQLKGEARSGLPLDRRQRDEFARIDKEKEECMKTAES